MADFRLTMSWGRRWWLQSLVEQPDPGLLRQPVSPGCDHVISWFEHEAVDLHHVAFPESDFDGVLDGPLSADQTDDPFAAFVLDQALGRNGQAITPFVDDDAHADELSRAQSGFGRDGNI